MEIRVFGKCFHLFEKNVDPISELVHKDVAPRSALNEPETHFLIPVGHKSLPVPISATVLKRQLEAQGKIGLGKQTPPNVIGQNEDTIKQ